MQEERLFEGYWWRSHDPDTRVPGTLSFSQEQIRLELLGAFEGIKPGPIGDVKDEPRIFGLTKDRKSITLVGNTGFGQSLNFPGFPVTTYGPQTVLVGAWYEPDEEILFHELRVRLSDLDTWAATSGFKQELRFAEDRKSVAGIDVSFTPPEPVDVALNDTTSLGITWAFTWSGWKQVTTSTALEQVASFHLTFMDGASLTRSFEYVHQLRNFLSLAVGRSIQVLAVTGIHRPDPDQPPDTFTGLEAHPIPVEILYRVIGRPEGDPPRELLLDETLFTLGDAQPQLTEIFQRWFERQNVLGPVFNRYFYIAHGEHLAREIQFESYVRALETYHRRNTDAGELPPEEHTSRLEAVLGSVPVEHREWLESRLRFSNEPSLAKRLSDTLARSPLVVKRLIGTKRDQKAFVRKVVTTRNYEVHLDPANAEEAVTGLAIVVLVFQLRALVEMTLLRDLGFSEDVVDRIFDRIGRYTRVARIRDAVSDQE